MTIILSGLTSLVITFLAIPSIIRISRLKNLFDVPDARKTHAESIPTLGGVGIFAGMIFSLTFWSAQTELIELQYIISSIMILFFMGIKDDLFNLVAYKKLIGQIVAAFILVHWAGIRITSFFGLFGVYDIPLWVSYAFSIFTIVVITNSLNLIDGIDTLAASVGIFASTIFGVWFYTAHQPQYVILSCCLVGSLLGFLYYNKTPAKIFMGDTGSLIVGAVLSILAIKFIELNRVMPLEAFNKIKGVPVFTISVLLIPLFDTLRVFTIRMLSGRSPFSPDRNHIHHLLVDNGLSHLKATAVLITYNSIVVVTVYLLRFNRSELNLLMILGASFLCSYLLSKRKTALTRVS